MKIAIHGIGVTGGFGAGIQSLESALRAGSCPPSQMSIETADGSVIVPAFLADTAPLEAHFPARQLRRLDHYVRLALYSGYMALQDASVADLNRDRLGIVVATGHGATCNQFDFYDPLSGEDADACYSPTKFANFVHNSAASYLAVFLKARGPNLTVSQLDMAFPSALLTACIWLEEERAEAVLMGGVDLFSKSSAHDREMMIRKAPDEQSSSPPLIIGEGSVFFLLKKWDGKSPPYGLIQKINIGRHVQLSPMLEKKAVTILSPNIQGRWPQDLVDRLPPDMPLSAYANLYGNLPIGMGFDLAIAVLSMKNKRIYPLSANPFFSSRKILKEELWDGRCLICLSSGTDGMIGNVVLSEDSEDP